MDALRIGVAAADLGVGSTESADDAKRLVSVVPTIIATYWRYRSGSEPIAPRDDLGHTANYLYMLTGEEPDPTVVRGLETYLNTVIDHGLNASTFVARSITSSDSDLVSAVTGAVGSLKGPLHGGAPGPVLEMLLAVRESGDPDGYIQAKFDAGERVMGFGHRVYRTRDPRAEVLSGAAERLYAGCGRESVLRFRREVRRDRGQSAVRAQTRPNPRDERRVLHGRAPLRRWRPTGAVHDHLRRVTESVAGSLTVSNRQRTTE